ncbi:unnamed protein product [Heterobilharzia americana]|nr:unnamed protein product [Heterobilharzia americana]
MIEEDERQVVYTEHSALSNRVFDYYHFKLHHLHIFGVAKVSASNDLSNLMIKTERSRIICTIGFRLIASMLTYWPWDLRVMSLVPKEWESCVNIAKEEISVQCS